MKGFLFSIEYDGGSGYFEEAAGMDPRPALDVRCDVVADLSAPV